MSGQRSAFGRPGRSRGRKHGCARTPGSECRARGRRIASLFAVILAASTPVTPIFAQADTASLHATLQGWAEGTWLLLLDRGAADSGRLNDRGTLQRFHPGIDAEYALDHISARFGLPEEYVWQRRANGIRFWAGSINHQDLISGAEFKVAASLGSGWSVQARFDKEETPPVNRDLLRLRFRRDWHSGPFGFVEGSLHAFKPEMDLTLGAGVRDAAGEVTISLSWLDAFNDAIYQGLVVWPGFADTAIDYERQSFAVRTSLERSFGRHFRMEADAALLLPSRMRAYRQLAPDSGFRQEERFAMAGILLEGSVIPPLRLGAFVTYVRAVSDRTPLAEGRAVDDFRLVERTIQAGAFALTEPARRWRVEAWVAREARPERREFRNGAAPDVDYEDQSWRGQMVVRYRSPRGFRAHAAFEMDLRDVLRGEGEVPAIEPLGRHHSRVRLEIGWQFAEQFQAAAGYRIDVDGDEYTHGDWFDGAHGRFVMYW